MYVYLYIAFDFCYAMISNGFPYSAKPYKAYSDDLTVTSLVKSSPISAPVRISPLVEG